MNINNKATKQVILDATAGQAIEEVPTLLKEIHGAIECNAQLVNPIQFVRSVTRSTSGTSTVISNTVVGQRDFYIVAVQVSLDCDATCDLTSAACSVTTEDGYSSNLVWYNKRTATALALHQFVSFPRPIKVKRNTGCGWTTTFSAGACTSSLTIYGFFIEP